MTRKDQLKNNLLNLANLVIPAVAKRNAGISTVDSGIFPKNGKNRNGIARHHIYKLFFYRS